MSEATYAFVFNGNDNDNWKLSLPDDWDLDIVSINGNEKVLGHKKIDGSICKVLKTNEGKLIALSRN